MPGDDKTNNNQDLPSTRSALPFASANESLANPTSASTPSTQQQQFPSPEMILAQQQQQHQQALAAMMAASSSSSAVSAGNGHLLSAFAPQTRPVYPGDQWQANAFYPMVTSPSLPSALPMASAGFNAVNPNLVSSSFPLANLPYQLSMQPLAAPGANLLNQMALTAALQQRTFQAFQPLSLQQQAQGVSSFAGLINPSRLYQLNNPAVKLEPGTGNPGEDMPRSSSLSSATSQPERIKKTRALAAETSMTESKSPKTTGSSSVVRKVSDSSSTASQVSELFDRTQDDAADDMSAGGERRLIITFSNPGTLGRYPQKIGKRNAFVPDGISGRFKMYHEHFTFRIQHGTEPEMCRDGVPRICITWTVINEASGEETSMTETPQDAMRRVVSGKTICNRVYKIVLEKRAQYYEREIELEMSKPDVNDCRVSHLASMVKVFRPRTFSLGPLAFGLLHSTVQERMLKEFNERMKARGESSGE